MAKKYFTGINYSLGNEDTSVEYEICRELKPQNTLSIAGSGGRSLPLLAFSQKLYIVDLSKEQLALCELRCATYAKLSYYDFLKFWGYPPFGDYDYSYFRKNTLQGLGLSNATLQFFKEVFGPIDYSSILYAGKWERTFQILSKGLRVILGKDFAKILSFNSLEDQINYYREEFPMEKWKLIIFLMGNKSVFNALLYKGDFVKKSLNESYFQFYFDAFDRLFTQQIARKSFFANLCFYGKIGHEDGNPMEARQTTFDELRPNIVNYEKNVHPINADIYSALEKIKNEANDLIDFVSFSDVPSYFSGALEKNFLIKIRPYLKTGSLVCVRYYLNVLNPDLSGFKDVSDEFSRLIKNECVQMYRIKIYKVV